jgi:hypothetical protein
MKQKVDKTPIFKWIWDVCPAKNGDKLVLLCLACFSEEDGSLWAAPEMLESKTGMTRRNIYRCIDRLIANGWLEMTEERRVEHGRLLCRRFKIPFSSDNLSNLPSSSDNLSVSLDNLSSSLDKLYTDKEHKEDNKLKTSATAPAPAASQPSLPSSSPVRPPQKRTAPKQDVDISDLSLPHGPEFRNWWVRFMDYRKQPIKGRRSPLTKLAAELILEDLAQISESDAMKALRDAITSSWIKPYTDRFERKAPASKVVPFKAKASDDSYEREILRRVGGLKA